jgi:hypothetical protein
MVINRVRDLLAGRRPAVPWGGTASSSARQPGSTLGLEEPRTAAASVQGPAAPAGSLEDYFDRLDAAFASMEGAPAAPPAVAHPAPIAAPADAGPSPQAQRAQASEASLPDGIANWDPDLTHDPRKPAAPAPPASPEPLRGYAPPAPSRTAVPQPAAPIQAVQALPVSRPETHVASTEAAAPVAAPPVHAAPVTPVPAVAPPAAPLPTLAEAFASLLSAEQGRTLLPPAVAPPGEALIEDIVQRVILRMGDQAVRATVTDIAERLVREEIQRIKSA